MPTYSCPNYAPAHVPDIPHTPILPVDLCPTGNLVSNAPHLPVHLGAMSEAVKFQIRHYGPGGAGQAEGLKVRHRGPESNANAFSTDQQARVCRAAQPGPRDPQRLLLGAGALVAQVRQPPKMPGFPVQKS